MTLFVEGAFTASSGKKLPWKIECDALSDKDWRWAAARVAERYSFRDVYGIPDGGLRFEKYLREHLSPKGDVFLIVDDVVTTGLNFEQAKKLTLARHSRLPRIGAALFAQPDFPSLSWITAIWRPW